MDISYMFGAQKQVRLFRFVLLLLTLGIAAYSYTAYAIRVSDKIYTKIQSEHYCSRRLNSTHQMGCTSELGGNLGIVWIVDDFNDLNHILKSGPTPPYIAVLRREHFTRKNLLDFKANPGRVSGVIFINDGTESRSKSQPFSPDDRCPNRYSGLYANDITYQGCKQNLWQQESPVSGLLYDDIPYPIFFINDKGSIDSIESCFKNNHILKEGKQKIQDAYPLCGTQLDSFMLAAGDTKTCLNSASLVNELTQSSNQRCDSIDNFNIFAYYKDAIGPFRDNNTTKKFEHDMIEPQSVVLLVAKRSSISMFSQMSPGADSTLSGMITMLVVADALSRVRNNTDVVKSKRNIGFALIDSEPFDYTGSSRLVYSMVNNSFPYIPLGYKTAEIYNITNSTSAMSNMNLESLDYVINLDQLASHSASSELYLHADPRNLDNSKMDRVVGIFDKLAKSESVKFQRSDPKLPLPPASVHEFIKNAKPDVTDKKLLGVVLGNYDKSYSNLYYHSVYDDTLNINDEKTIDHFVNVASFVAKSLYQLAFQVEKADDIKINKELVRDLLECYLHNAQCLLFKQASLTYWDPLPQGPIQTYKDPQITQSQDLNGLITRNLLSYFLGEHIKDYNESRCREENSNSRTHEFLYLKGNSQPICVRSQVIEQSSQSPAYGRTDEGITVDEKYPAWTVSLNRISNPVRLYMKPSPLHQWCIFLLGVVVTLMSFVIVRQIRGSVSQLKIESETLAGTPT